MLAALYIAILPVKGAGLSEKCSGDLNCNCHPAVCLCDDSNGCEPKCTSPLGHEDWGNGIGGWCRNDNDCKPCPKGADCSNPLICQGGCDGHCQKRFFGDSNNVVQGEDL